MPDRDMVIKSIENCLHEKECDDCPYEGCIHACGNCIGDLMAHALLLLKKQEQTFFVDSDGKITPLPIQPQWISVEDRLPDDASDVLVYYDNGTESRIIPVNYYKGCWYDCVFNRPIDDLETGFIGYWMSLPEPPKEGN